MTGLRALAAGALVVAALVLQISVFPHVAWDGVVPNLALLVVVGAGLTRGPQFAMTLGFVSGVLLDLAPPADHSAGRWALALLLVGYVAGRVRQDVRPSAGVVVATVAASSFLGTSVFALSGLVLGDLDVGIGGLLQVIGVAVLWDVLLTPLVLPVVMRVLDRSELGRTAAAPA
jgi:rod shape-determining protein MreD